jgi:hypothetical protein
VQVKQASKDILAERTGTYSGPRRKGKSVEKAPREPPQYLLSALARAKRDRETAYAKVSKELAEGGGSDLVRLLNSGCLLQPKANILAAKNFVPPTRPLTAGADAALKDLPRLFEHVANCKERVRVQSEMLSSIQANLAALPLERCGEEEHEGLVADRDSAQEELELGMPHRITSGMSLDINVHDHRPFPDGTH